MLSCPAAGQGQGPPFYGGLGKGCYPPPATLQQPGLSLAGTPIALACCVM